MSDELNLVKPGFNSGWAVIQGQSFLQKNFNQSMLENFQGKGTYRDPEFIWLDTIAPTSVLFLNSNKLGKEYENDLFIGTAKNGLIYQFDLNQKRDHLSLKGTLRDRVANYGDEMQDIIFAKGFGVISDLKVGPDGFLYILVYDGRIYRVVPQI
jgi:aldose sugar dehydrogenase